MTKADLVHGLAILLCLDPIATKDLQKLKIETLEQMFYNYKENALQAQRMLEDEVAKSRKYGPAARSDTRTRKARRKLGKSNTA